MRPVDLLEMSEAMRGELSPVARELAARFAMGFRGLDAKTAQTFEFLEGAKKFFANVSEPKASELEAKNGPGKYGAGVEPMGRDELVEVCLELEEKPAERLKRIEERLDRARGDSSEADWTCVLFLLTADGRGHIYQVSEAEGGSCRLEPIPDDEDDFGARNVLSFYNRVRPLLEEISSRLNFTGALFKCYPRASSPEHENAARIATKVARWLCDSPEGRRKMHRYSLLAPVLGGGVSRVGWDRTAMSSRRLPNGQIVRGPYGWLESEILGRHQFMSPADACCPELSDADWAADDTLIPWSEVGRRWGPEKAKLTNPMKPCEGGHAKRRQLLLDARNVENSVFAFGGGGSGGSDVFVDRAKPKSGLTGRGEGGAGPEDSLGRGSGRGDAQVLRTRYCEKVWNKKLGAVFIQQTILVQGQWMESKPLVPLWRDPRTGEEMVKLQADGTPKLFGMPWRIGHYHSLVDCLHGRGPVGDGIDLIDALADLDAVFLSSVYELAMTLMMHSAANGVSPFYRRGGLLVARHDMPEPPTFYKPPSNLQDLMLLMDVMEKRLEQVFAAQAADRGELPASGTSGRTVNALVREAEGARRNIVERTRAFHADRIRRELEQLQWNADLEVVFEGVGRGDASGSAVFRGVDLEGGTDVRESMENEIPKDEASRYEIAERRLKLGAMDPEAVPDFIKGTGSFEEIDSFFQNDEQARRAIAKVLAMGDGECRGALTMIDMMQKLADQMARQQQAATGLPTDPILAQQKARSARNDVLKTYGIGVEDFSNAARQAWKTRMWLNSEDGVEAPPWQRALVAARYQALVDKAAVLPGLAQQRAAAPPLPPPASSGAAALPAPGGGGAAGGGGSPSGSAPPSGGAPEGGGGTAGAPQG